MDVTKLLYDNGIQFANDVRANMGSAGMNATNETAHSIRIEVKESGSKYTLEVFGRPYFMTIQTGRKPTPDKKPSREMIDRITAWVEARNMDQSAVWAIATNINKKGTRLWQQGGRTDIVDPAVDDLVNNVAQGLLDGAMDDFSMVIRTWQSQ